jgi:hypothetical protein
VRLALLSLELPRVFVVEEKPQAVIPAKAGIQNKIWLLSLFQQVLALKSALCFFS